MNRFKRKRLSTVGRRTGVDLKRKHIRITENGVENFGDYFSSPESSDSSDESSPESSPTSSSKNNPMTSSPLRSGAPRMSSFIKDKEKTKTTPTRACKNLSFSKSPDANEAVTPVKKSKNKETHPRYSFGNKTNASSVENNLSSPIQKSEKQKRFAKGRRTGVLLDEKRIGIKDGFEIFNDYFTDTNSENSSQSGYSKISKEPPSSLCSEAPQPGIDTMRQSIPQSSHLESSQSTTYIDKNKSNVVSASKGSPTRSSAVKQLLISLHPDQTKNASSLKLAEKRGSINTRQKSPLKSPRTFNKTVSFSSENAAENMETNLSVGQRYSKASVKEFLTSSNSEVNESCSESEVSETDKQSEVNLNLTVNKGQINAGSKSKITEDIHDHSFNLNSLQHNKFESQSKDQIKVKSSLESAEKRRSISFTSQSKKAKQKSPLKSPKSFNKRVSLLSEDAVENMETRLSSEVNESCSESEVSETDKQSEGNLNVTVNKSQTNAGSKSKITEDVHDKSSNFNDIQPDNMSKSLRKDQIEVESSIMSAKKRGSRSFTSKSKENILESPSKSHRTFNKRVSLLNENASENMKTRLSAGQKHSKTPVKELLTSSNSEVNEFCSESDVSETDKQSEANLNLTVNKGKTNAGSKFKTTVVINEQSSSLNGLPQDNISKSLHTDQIEVESSMKSARKRGSKSSPSKSKESKLESSLKSPKKFNKRVSMQSEGAIRNMEMRLSSGQKHSKASVNEFSSSSNSEVHGSCSDSDTSETDKQSESNLNLTANKGKTNAVSKFKITKDIHNEPCNLNGLQQDNMSKSLHQGQIEVESVIKSAKKRESRSFISKSKENILESSLKSPRTFNKRVSLLNEDASKSMKSFSSGQKQSRTSVQEIHSSGNSEVHESTDDSSVLQKGKKIQKSPETQTNLTVTKGKTKAQKKSKKADGQKEENQVRRSERVKVPPLERWRGQCRFTKLVNGEWITVFEEGRPEDNSAVEKIMKKQKNYQLQKKKEKSGTKYIKKRKLKDNTLNLEEVKGEISKIPVVNPSTSEEECVYLYRPYKTLLWSTPAAYDSHNAPYSISKCITGKNNLISFGYIDIEVSETKAAQYSPTDNITYNIIQGKVRLKLYKSLINLKERDVVTVPCFNNYSITNTGKVNAILYYCSFKTPLFSYQCFENSDKEEE